MDASDCETGWCITVHESLIHEPAVATAFATLGLSSKAPIRYRGDTHHTHSVPTHVSGTESTMDGDEKEVAHDD